MTNALDVGKKALALWRDNHGDESLYEQCQRYDGFYWDWAYEGSTSGIIEYPTAHDAYLASSRFSTSGPNDSRIKPGDNLWFSWPTPDHVVTAVGWDERGTSPRLLVTNTANGGDVVFDWTNNVKVCHADTIDLAYAGASHGNGRNSARSGLDAYILGGENEKLPIQTLYQTFLENQKVGSNWTYLYLNDEKDITVVSGKKTSATGSLYVAFTPDGTPDAAAALQVRAVVDTLDSKGNRIGETSLGIQEIGMSGGSWLGFVPLPPVALADGNHRVRFQHLGSAGLTGKITSAVFRGVATT